MDIKIVCGDFCQDYDCKDMVGEGTYGKVFRAYHRRTKELKAIKVMELPEAMVEVCAFSSFNHPNILKPEALYISSLKLAGLVMPLYIHNLQDWVRSNYGKRGYMTKSNRIFNQVVAGMLEVRKLGWAHLDLKPHNILLNADTDMAVIDFGLACYLGVPNDKHLTTRSKQTITYRAPEVFNITAGFPADVWSIGAVGYKLFTGKDPFYWNPDSKLSEIKDNGSHITPASVRAKLTNLPKNYNLKTIRGMPTISLIRKMMVVDYKKRIPLSELMDNPEEIEIRQAELWARKISPYIRPYELTGKVKNVWDIIVDNFIGTPQDIKEHMAYNLLELRMIYEMTGDNIKLFYLLVEIFSNQYSALFKLEETPKPLDCRIYKDFLEKVGGVFFFPTFASFK
jgi:serine/threonine protein kinase